MNEAYWVVNNVYAVSAGNFKNFFLPSWFRVVDKIVRSGIFLDRVELGL